MTLSNKQLREIIDTVLEHTYVAASSEQTGIYVDVDYKQAVDSLKTYFESQE
jgi:hypothetical protein